MTTHPRKVETFIRAADTLFQSETLPQGSRVVAARVFERLREPSDDGKRRGERFPACH